MSIRRRLQLIAACRLCGATQFKKDAVAIECGDCGAIRPRKAGDEGLVALMAEWEDCPLTPKELGALRQVFVGRTIDQASARLGVSSSTVRTHLHHAYQKLDAPGSVQACLIAYERGWIRFDEKGRDGRSC